MERNSPLALAYRAMRPRGATGADGVYRKPTPARDALARARDALAHVANLTAEEQAARDALAVAEQVAAPFLASGFGPHTVTPPEAGDAIRAVKVARNVAANLARCLAGAKDRLRPDTSGAYGPGTWQGGDTAPEGFARVLNPEQVAKGSPPSRMATAMHGGSKSQQVGRYGGRTDRDGQRFYYHGESGEWRALRHVRDADSVCRDLTGYCDNPHGDTWRDGSGVVVGMVAQLRARDGRAVYVPGFRFKGHEDSGTFDMGDLYTADGRSESDAEEAERDAARAGDALAEQAAERERDYQSAWGAGSEWATLAGEVRKLRADALAILRERRTARTLRADAFPALCDAIRDRVSDLRERIADARAEMARLVDGDGTESGYWHDGGPDARAAFCEAAGVDTFPDDSATWRAVRAIRAARRGVAA